MDLTVNYPRIKNNKSFGSIKFEDGTASEIAHQAAKFYPKGQKGNSFYDSFLTAMDSFVLRQDENKEVDIVVKHSKDWLGRKRIVAEVLPTIQDMGVKVFKQPVKPQKGRLLEFLCNAEECANQLQAKIKDIKKIVRPILK